MDPRAPHYCPRCGTRRDGAGACARDGTALVATRPESLLGTELGNYVLVQQLGEGGMGAVYRAVQPAIGAEVAIKVLHATGESQALAVQRFLLEAQAVNRVRHPNLVRIVDTGYLADRRPYLVMELLDGIALADAIGQIPSELACDAAAEALDALDAVHERGIIHRDLKPANVFLGRDGRVVVLDFGVAKLVDSADGRAAASTGLVGTPEYMAPEQIRSEPLDRRTDVYAMGVLLYEAITGKRPFAATATFELLLQHIERPPSSPRNYVPELAQPICDAILRALEKEPSRRFATARDMAGALRAAIAGASRRDALAAYVAARAGAPRPVPIESRDLLPASRTADDSGRRQVWAPRPASDPAAPTRAEKSSAARRDRRPPRRGLAIVAVIGGGAAIAGTALVVALGGSRHAAAVDAAPPRAIESARVIAPDAAAPPDAGEPTGWLEVRSIPNGAAVTVDHIARGLAPVSLQLPVGAHLVHAELSGYLAIDDATEVHSGEHTDMVLRLPQRATSSGTTRPRDRLHRPELEPWPTDASVATPPTSPIAGSGAPVDAGQLPARKGNPYTQ
jgi:hypothetical protein